MHVVASAGAVRYCVAPAAPGAVGLFLVPASLVSMFCHLDRLSRWKIPSLTRKTSQVTELLPCARREMPRLPAGRQAEGPWAGLRTGRGATFNPQDKMPG
jgi:hypothetical protein